MQNEKKLKKIANLMRRDVLEMTTAAGSGHPTSCLSCAEIISVLFFYEMKYDIKNALNPNNDEFILSKGHAAPILYSALYRAGCIKESLIKLRKLNSDLEGHPVPHKKLKWIRVASGSLGQGLSIGVGMALATKLLGRENRVYVLIGDGEMAEGSNFEALQLAPYYNLNNLCLIIDVNRLGQRGTTIWEDDLKKYEVAIRSFKWNAIVVDGHNVKELINAFDRAKKSNMPTAIISKTVKGKGVSFLENKEEWHGKVLNKEQLKNALKEIENVKMPKVKVNKPKNIKIFINKKSKIEKNFYKRGDFVSTREAFGKALASLAKSDSKIIAVDGEVSNSTFLGEVRKVRPGQFIEAFIAEQNMVSICLGLDKKGFNVFGATFAAFLTRAHDQIRMASISGGNFTLCGSHAGVSIGEDGVSQMGLEDIAMFRALPNSIIFYPSDAVSTEKIVFLASKIKGIKYIRTTRGKTPVLYENNEKFKVGEYKILKQTKKDKAVLVGAGITLHECIKAHEILKNKKTNVAVIDLYCIKPFNKKKFIEFIKTHGNKIVVVEDHYKEGGIGEMLAENLENTRIKVKHLFIEKIPHSGKPEELLRKYKIDADAIVKTVENFNVL